MITADNITVAQIRELRDRMYARVARGADSKDDRETHAICESALNEMCHPIRRREAFASCAEIVNAGAASTKLCPKQVHVDEGWPAGQCLRAAGHTGLCDVYDGRTEEEREAGKVAP